MADLLALLVEGKARTFVKDFVKSLEKFAVTFVLVLKGGPYLFHLLPGLVIQIYTLGGFECKQIKLAVYRGLLNLPATRII